MTAATTGPVCPDCGAANRAEARFCRSCGTDLTKIPVPAPELGPDGLASGDADASERRRLTRRLLFIGVGLAAALVLYLGFVSVRNTFYPPDKPVKEFFAALQNRDGDTLRRLVRCSSPLCRPGALDSGYQPPEHVVVVKTEQRDAPLPNDPTKRPLNGYAEVTVTYTLGNTPFLQHIPVVRNNDGLLFRSWSLWNEPGAAVDVVSITKKTAKLGNAVVETTPPPASGFNPPAAPYAPPGIYALSSSDDPLLVSANDVVIVGGDTERQQVNLNVSVNPTATAEVDGLIRARVDACATQDAFAPSVGQITDGCYFGHNTQYAFTRKVHWTIVDYPKIELQITEDALHDTGGVEVHTVTPGHAMITYEYTLQVLEPRTWTQITATEPINPRGPVSVTNGKIMWSS